MYLGVTGNTLCPLAAILDFMVRHGQVEGPFFLLADGPFLTRDCFMQAVKEALSNAGVNSSSYSGHSLRIRTVTTVASHGIPDAVIKMLGWWDSSISIYDVHSYLT